MFNAVRVRRFRSNVSPVHQSYERVALKFRDVRRRCTLSMYSGRAFTCLVALGASCLAACGTDAQQPRGTPNGGAAGAGATSSGGAASSSGGTTGVSGSVGSSGAGGTSTGTAGVGGSVSGAGGTAGGGSSGAGAGGGSALHGGSSARFVCAPGASYGNPLAGMGQVVTISPPTTGPVTFFAYIEGPLWIGSLGKLFFSDNVTPERIWQLVPPSTTPSIFLQMSGSNGLAVDNDDKLVLADQAMHRIVRVDPATAAFGQVIVPAGNYKPNDLIVRSDNNLYFTDPALGFYRVSPTGTLTGPITMVSAPNGIDLSPDENTLYVGDVNMRSITKFPLAADGTVTAASGTLFTMTVNGTVDGLAVDCAGNVYASTSGGVEVFSSAGSPLGTIQTGGVSNVTFGAADRKTLYATFPSAIKAVTLAVPGLPD
jgi:gluconolactonase